jgi:hypothetical protein
MGEHIAGDGFCILSKLEMTACVRATRKTHTHTRSLITRFYLSECERGAKRGRAAAAYPGSAHLDHISKPTLRDGVNFACAHQQAADFIRWQWSN